MFVAPRGQDSSCTNPLLVFTMQVGGFLTDVTGQLQYQIFDVSDETKQATPVQVFPSSPGMKATVSIGDVCPAGDKLSLGRFLARWSVPSGESIGRHEVRWFCTLNPSATEVVYRVEFDVIPDLMGIKGQHYCSVSDMRDELLLSSEISDVKLTKIINRCSRLIEEWTGRSFDPVYKTLVIDGRGRRSVFLGEPIVGIESMNLYTNIDILTTLDNTLVKIYNRHLTENMIEPDDRDDARIEMFHSSDLWGTGVTRYRPNHWNLTFPESPQIVSIPGVYGFTDWDGTPAGRTPEMIKHLCKLLTIREFTPLRDTDQRDDFFKRQLLRSIRTREQAVTYQTQKNATGWPTGDPEIDLLVAKYMRPSQHGAA